MAKPYRRLFEQANKALEGYEPLTPYETPALLHEVDREFLIWLFSAALRYGFTQYSKGKCYRSTFLSGPNGPIKILAKTLPGPFVLCVGEVNERPYEVIVVERGLILWQKNVLPGDVRIGLERLDEAMGYAGQGVRPDPFQSQVLFRVRDTFADPNAFYVLKATWHEQNVLEMFDEPERLTVVETDGVRLLTLKGAIIKAPTFHAESIDDVIERQYSPRSRS